MFDHFNDDVLLDLACTSALTPYTQKVMRESHILLPEFLFQGEIVLWTQEILCYCQMATQQFQIAIPVPVLIFNANGILSHVDTGIPPTVHRIHAQFSVYIFCVYLIQSTILILTLILSNSVIVAHTLISFHIEIFSMETIKPVTSEL